MRTDMNDQGFRELTFAILELAVKDDDQEFFNSEYAELLCEAVNINVIAVRESFKKKNDKTFKPWAPPHEEINNKTHRLTGLKREEQEKVKKLLAPKTPVELNDTKLAFSNTKGGRRHGKGKARKG